MLSGSRSCHVIWGWTVCACITFISLVCGISDQASFPSEIASNSRSSHDYYLFFGNISSIDMSLGAYCLSYGPVFLFGWGERCVYPASMCYLNFLPTFLRSTVLFLFLCLARTKEVLTLSQAFQHFVCLFVFGESAEEDEILHSTALCLVVCLGEPRKALLGSSMKIGVMMACFDSSFPCLWQAYMQAGWKFHHYLVIGRRIFSFSLHCPLYPSLISLIIFFLSLFHSFNFSPLSRSEITISCRKLIYLDLIAPFAFGNGSVEVVFLSLIVSSELEYELDADARAHTFSSVILGLS